MRPAEPDNAPLRRWIAVNSGLFDELDAGRKIMASQLRASVSEPADLESIRDTALELTATVLLLRGLPAAPEPALDAHLQASLDAFERALGELLLPDRIQTAAPAAAVARLTYAVQLMDEVAQHAEAVNDAIQRALGP